MYSPLRRSFVDNTSSASFCYLSGGVHRMLYAVKQTGLGSSARLGP